MKSQAVVVYNGPSRLSFSLKGFQGPLIGCNFAYRDWPLTHCVAIDRMTVAAIRGELERKPLPCEFWTKETPLELPPHWHHRPSPGIDSGSLAIQLALDLADKVLVIGADGICGGSTITAYQYPWHGTNPKRTAHHRHRVTCLSLSGLHPTRIQFAWPDPVEGLETIALAEAQTVINKYSNSEDSPWPSQSSSNETPKVVL